MDERNSAILIQRKQSFPDVETSYIMVTIPMQYRVVVVVLFCLFFPPIYRCVLKTWEKSIRTDGVLFSDGQSATCFCPSGKAFI